MQESIFSELHKFQDLKDHFKHNISSYEELDTYGFSLVPKNEVEILFTGLTHGNELIGIQIINLMLEHIKENPNFSSKIAFLLNNVEAYKKNVRFLETDLNRSFCRTHLETLEHKRAREIETVIESLNLQLIIDLHQTSEPSDGVFMMVPEIAHHIRIANNITTKCPIVTYSASEGFSSKGKTLGEFAEQKAIIEVVFELGQKGFNLERATEYKNLLLQLNLNCLENVKVHSQDIEYLHLTDKVPLLKDYRLVNGIRSLSSLKKGEILARHIENQSLEYKCPQDAVAIFPRYENITDFDTELTLLAFKKKLSL